jgi:DNA-binding MarR family transcriptional regulator
MPASGYNQSIYMGSHTSSSDIRLVLDSFRRIVHVLRLFDREAQKRLGLSGAQVFVLEKLREADGISINELADRTHTHQSSVSVVVQKLAGLKMVERAASPTDGRRVELFLTKKGKRLLASAPPAAQGRLISAIGALPKTSRGLLGRLLLELIENTGIDRQSPALFFEDHAPRQRRGRSKELQSQ